MLFYFYIYLKAEAQREGQSYIQLSTASEVEEPGIKSGAYMG